MEKYEKAVTSAVTQYKFNPLFYLFLIIGIAIATVATKLTLTTALLPPLPAG